MEWQIKYLPHQLIDKQKWDSCIIESANGLLYAQSIYLDAMADNWDAIIVNDYTAVVPLPWRYKYFIKYLYQPFFIQQLGIFSKTKIPPKVVEDVFTLLMQRFSFAEMNINLFFKPAVPAITFSERANFVLDINKTYQEICSQYEKGFLKNLRRTYNFKHKYSSDSEYAAIVDLYQKLYGSRFPHLKNKDYSRFKELCNKLGNKGMVFGRRITNTKGELLATAIFFKDEKRIYNIMSCLTLEGRAVEANYFLYDKLIAEFCNQGLILDMEGSDIKGIADFYRSIGCINEPYQFIKINKLPWPLKLLK